MANGTPIPDVIKTRPIQEFNAANKFTPFSNEMLRNAQTTEIRSPEIKDEPPIHEQQTDTVEVDKLMAQIMNQEGPKKPQEAISQIEKNLPQEKKSQGFFTQIIEWFKTTFRNLFR